jgi:hypothetical protein
MDECLNTGWSNGQAAAMLEKYYADHPEYRHLVAANQLHDALSEVCQ